MSWPMYRSAATRWLNSRAPTGPRRRAPPPEPHAAAGERANAPASSPMGRRRARRHAHGPPWNGARRMVERAQRRCVVADYRHDRIPRHVGRRPLSTHGSKPGSRAADPCRPKHRPMITAAHQVRLPRPELLAASPGASQTAPWPQAARLYGRPGATGKGAALIKSVQARFAYDPAHPSGEQKADGPSPRRAAVDRVRPPPRRCGLPQHARDSPDQAVAIGGSTSAPFSLFGIASALPPPAPPTTHGPRAAASDKRCQTLLPARHNEEIGKGIEIGKIVVGHEDPESERPRYPEQLGGTASRRLRSPPSPATAWTSPGKHARSISRPKKIGSSALVALAARQPAHGEQDRPTAKPESSH